MMSPSILLRDDEVRGVLGSGGSKRLRTALLQTISWIVDFDLSVREAVEHPRLHWDGERVQAEPELPAELLAALHERVDVNEWECQDLYFGGVNAVIPGREGAGDPRRGGAARTVEVAP